MSARSVVDEAREHALAELRTAIVAAFDAMQASPIAAGDHAARCAIANMRGIVDHLDRVESEAE